MTDIDKHEPDTVDIGHDHLISYFGFSPDRELNPQYADVPDIEKLGIRIDHKHPETGEPCVGAVMFDVPEYRAVADPGHVWHVESFEPLTLSPSVLCRACGDHGYIRDGKWVPA